MTRDEALDHLIAIDAAKDDYVKAGALERDLWEMVLCAIAAGSVHDASEMALLALASRNYEFPRVA